MPTICSIRTRQGSTEVLASLDHYNWSQRTGFPSQVLDLLRRRNQGSEPPATGVFQKGMMRPDLAEMCKVLHETQTAVEVAPNMAALSRVLSIS
jgi:hypothetical protein